MAATSDEENGIFEEEGAVKLYIKTLRRSQFYTYVCLTETTVMDVKKVIQSVLGNNPRQQLLYHNGAVLEDDDSTLAKNNISENDFLFLMPIVPEDPIITVHHPRGAPFSVYFEPFRTVMDVKKNIEVALGNGFPCHRQLLYLDKVLLKDMDTLHASKVNEEDNLTVELSEE